MRISVRCFNSMHRMPSLNTVFVLLVVVLCTNCSPEVKIPPGYALVEGTIGTSHEKVAFFQLSRDDYQKCTEAHRAAHSHPEKVAPGFWTQYFELSPTGYTAGLEVRKGKFKAIVPKGHYVMAVPEKGYGRFLPVQVDADMQIDYAEEAAHMGIDL